MLSFTFTHRATGLLPRLIQWFQGGKYNHVIIGVDGVYFEAIGGRPFGVNGVVMSPDKFSYHKGKYQVDDHETIYLGSTNVATDLVYTYLASKVGSGYDIKNFISYALRWLKGDAAKYTCVELALSAYEIAKGKEFELKYTVQEFYELIK